MIIVLTTYEFADSEKLVDYLSFGLTLSSILLAIVAIFYSIVSNSELARTLGTMSGSSTELQSVTKDLQLATDQLSVQVAQVPGSIDAMKETIDATHESVSLMMSQSEGSEVVSVETSDRSFSAEAFLRTTSMNGLFTCYAMHLAEKNGASFLLSDVAEVIGSSSDYLHGYLIALGGIGVVTWKQTPRDAEENIWGQVDINDGLGSASKEALTLRKQYYESSENETRKSLGAKVETKIEELEQLLKAA